MGLMFGVVIFILSYIYIYIYVYSKLKVEIVISKSINKNKKFDAKINGTKHISFGDSNYSGYTKT